MTLDDIQDSIYLGDQGIKRALDLLQTYLEKHPDKKEVMANSIWNFKTKYQQLSPSFANQIKVTKKYLDPLKFAIGSFKGTTISPTAVATFVMDNVTQEANRKIISAKEPKTRRNREFEKAIITKFLHGNYNQLVLLVELYRMFQEIKAEINLHGTN